MSPLKYKRLYDRSMLIVNDYMYGYRQGLKRAFYGFTVVSDAVHNRYFSAKYADSLIAKGYRDGFAHRYPVTPRAAKELSKKSLFHKKM